MKCLRSIIGVFPSIVSGLLLRIRATVKRSMDALLEKKVVLHFWFSWLRLSTKESSDQGQN